MRLRLAAVVLAAGLLTAAPARAAVPAGNLLTDPGGEAATASPDGSTAVPPPGWTVNGPFSVVAYGTPEFLTTDDAAALGGGVNFFAGGPDNAESTATQIVTVVGAAAEIDAGTLTATLSGQLGGYAEQPDSVTVTATYIDGATAALGTLTIGPVTDVDRGDVTKLLARSASGTVPVGTRAIVVRIDALRTSGAFNDGYADNISLTLGNGTPEFHKTVVAGVISGKVLVKKPGAKGFVALDGSQGIPLGSTVDTRNGRVELTSVPKRGGAPEKAQFYDGIFKVTQPGAITQLQLVEALACGGKSAAATAAAKKPKTRKLWGSGSGSFRTRGQYSAATVRGTTWLVQDSCSSTLTRVTKGAVSVQDFVKHKTVIVRAGKRYTARR